jgi:multidrug efflux system outer membrane protein
VGPIFDAGRNRGNLQAARSRFDQAVIGYEQVVQQALFEVNTALSAYGLSAKQRLAQDRLIAASERYYQLALARYRNGTIAYLDVLDANRRLFEAQLSRSQTLRDQLNSLVGLYRALGGGWKE